MLRLAEIGLFLLPFGLFLVWRVVEPRVRPAVLWIGTVIVVGVIGMVVGYGLHNRMDPYSRYEPAHMQNGQIVPGRGVSQ
jgi:hypothetical protein